MSEITRSLQEVTELISLPEVYLKVRRLMDDDTSDIYDFAEVISVDPNLSTRGLKIARNSNCSVNMGLTRYRVTC